MKLGFILVDNLQLIHSDRVFQHTVHYIVEILQATHAVS